jgi:deferrochelatase/peroxidase EfeB
MASLALAEIQRPVLRSSSRRFVAHAILRFKKSAEARRLIDWLSTQPGFVDSSAKLSDQPDAAELSLGFTYRGLERLRVPALYLRVFQNLAPAFSHGAPVRAAEHLGDTGEGAAQWWESAFRLEDAHAIVTVQAETAAAIKQQKDQLQAQIEVSRGAVEINVWLDGERLDGPGGPGGPEGAKEFWTHFGFRDGLSKVYVRGAVDPTDGTDSTDAHEPGEFVLGHTNDGGYNPWALSDLPQKMRSLFHNASFGAFRKIEQDEPRFQSSVERWAAQVLTERGLPADPKNMEWSKQYVKAKLCGRWPQGWQFDPLNEDQPELSSKVPKHINFSKDSEGFGCPFGAHIRRMNPRDVGNVNEGVVHARQRPLMRRGMPYGPVFDDAPSQERGLLGLFFCASLEDQFEHLLGQWADRVPLGLPDKGNAKDPLIGQHEDGNAVFDIPRKANPSHLLDGFLNFARTRGTLYAFYPSRRALTLLSAGDYAPDDDEEGDA